MEWRKKKKEDKIVSDLLKSGQNELADALFVTINAQHLHWHKINIIFDSNHGMTRAKIYS